jgi:hypothetical protein
MKRVLLVLAIVLAATAALSAPAGAESPSIACTHDKRLDVWWDSQGNMYECRCVRFPGETEHWCSWFKVPPARKPHAAKPKATPASGVGMTAPPALSSSTGAPGTSSDPYLAGDSWAQANL